MRLRFQLGGNSVCDTVSQFLSDRLAEPRRSAAGAGLCEVTQKRSTTGAAMMAYAPAPPAPAGEPHPTPSPSPPPPAFHRVCSLDELRAAPGSRRVVRLPPSGRHVLVLRLPSGALAALDERCYHHGGPLSQGGIEELGGVTCVTCPWHRYRIDAGTGECLYVGLDPATGAQSVRAKRGGSKQRAHPVELQPDGGVWVADSSLAPGAPPVESDGYALGDDAPQPQDAAGAAAVAALAAAEGGGGGGSPARIIFPLHSSFVRDVPQW